MKNMRRILLTSVAILMITTMVSAKMRGRGDGTGSGKSKNLFVVKTDRKLVGAKVEVFYGDGGVVSSQTLHGRKMIIDFADVKEGEYTIRVSKGDTVKEFHYEKK
jgi:hypothetical protein